MTDWTNARVVRDGDGGLWGRHGITRWTPLAMMGTGAAFTTDELLSEFGPLTPVLDADGLPVVRTVGDLTLRQLRFRPQIRLRVGDDEGTLYAGHPLGLLTPGGIVDVDLDTPCEVLP